MHEINVGVTIAVDVVKGRCAKSEKIGNVYWEYCSVYPERLAVRAMVFL